ncbi:MAG: host attachment protein [Planctomycetota bacterium]
MTNQNQWIVVADAARARVLGRDDNGLTLLHEYEHPESRLHTVDLDTGEGSAVTSGGPGHQPHMVGVGSRVPAHEQEAQRFAHELVRMLEDAHNRGQFGNVVLVAPAHFLGQIRKMLAPTVGRCVSTSFDKDLTRLHLPELLKHVDMLLMPQGGNA